MVDNTVWMLTYVVSPKWQNNSECALDVEKCTIILSKHLAQQKPSTKRICYILQFWGMSEKYDNIKLRVQFMNISMHINRWLTSTE